MVLDMYEYLLRCYLFRLVLVLMSFFVIFIWFWFEECCKGDEFVKEGIFVMFGFVVRIILIILGFEKVYVSNRYDFFLCGVRSLILVFCLRRNLVIFSCLV